MYEIRLTRQFIRAIKRQDIAALRQAYEVNVTPDPQPADSEAKFSDADQQNEVDSACGKRP